MSEEESSGIGTTTTIVLILVGFLLVAWVVNSGAFPRVKEQFSEVLNIGEEVFNKEEIKSTQEEKRANDIFKVFDEIAKTGDVDCIKKLDLSSFKGSGLNVNFENNKLKVAYGDNIRVYPFTLSKSVSLFKQTRPANGKISINDNFDEVNDASLGDYVYVAVDRVYILDEVTSADFKGEFSPIFKRKECGNAQEKIQSQVKNLNADGDLLALLNTNYGYLGNYKVSDALANFAILEYNKQFDLALIWRQNFNKASEYYFKGKYGSGSNNLRIVVLSTPSDLYQGRLTTAFSYDISIGEIIPEETATMELSDGTKIALKIN